VNGNTITVRLGALAAGSSVAFPVIATGNTAGPATVRANLSSPDGTATPGMVALTVLTAQERFVQALYLDELGRAGALVELDFWVGVFNSPGGTKAVVTGIEGSFEARDRLVKGWYQTYLGRMAMNGEEIGSANMLETETEEQVLSQLLGGSEFFTHAQTLSATGTPDQRFVQALYLLVLNRTGAMSEVAFWVNQLPQLGRQGVALAFLQSPEYRTDVVNGYYTTLLHRPADGVGLAGWVSSNLDVGSVRIGFESSPEFFSNG